MKKHTLLVSGLASAMFLAGCSSAQTADSEFDAPVMVEPTPVVQPAPQPMAQSFNNNYSQPENRYQQQPELIKITGIGYGAESTYEAYTNGQRRLMAIRSSKLDAYRALAEQLYGIKIDSNTSVATLTANNDSYRARVNAIVRGARVVSITPMADKNYETVLEVYVDKVFFRNAFVYSGCQGSNCGSNIIDPSELCGQGTACQTLGTR